MEGMEGVEGLIGWIKLQKDLELLPSTWPPHLPLSLPTLHYVRSKSFNFGPALPHSVAGLSHFIGP